MFDFTEREVKDILISLFVLSLVFAYPEILFEPLFFVFSVLTVGIAFIGHELSHRFVARRLGFHSEYVMWKQGLLMALILAFVTNGSFIFAAPGAVVFASYFAFRRPGLNEIGRIGIAGTVFNITLLYIFAVSYFLTGISILAFAGIINGWFAIFNLIPFGPLDGRKVMKWNMGIWITAFILAIIGFGMLYVF
jgi:Zn-dependent protease